MCPSHVAPGLRRDAFAPLDGNGRVDAVTNRLIDSIHGGLLSDGEQLPSELELAGQLGVATVTLREALSQLRQMGLVRTRRGRGGGTFVHAPDADQRQHLIERLAGLEVGELRDLGDQRLAVGVAAAELAAQRASEVDLALLGLHLDQQFGAATGGVGGAGYPTADWHFHVELAAAARSSRLTESEAELQGELGSMLWRAAARPAEAVLDEHREILSAVSAREPARAGRLMREHLALELNALIGARLVLVGAGGGRAGRGSSGVRATQTAEVDGVSDGSESDLRAASDAVLAPLRAVVGDVFAAIDRLAAATAEIVSAADDGGRPLRRVDLGPLRALISEQLLDAPIAVYSTGVAFASGLLADAPHWLEWWWLPADRPVALDLVLERDDPHYYDYEQVDWFTVPRETGERWIAGPFVDYGCTNCSVFTLTQAIVCGQRFVGVAGADITTQQVEALSAPALAAIGRPAALLNRRRRVIASNSVRWLPGTLCDLVSEAEVAEISGPEWTERADGVTLLRSPELDWTLVTSV